MHSRSSARASTQFYSEFVRACKKELFTMPPKGQKIQARMPRMTPAERDAMIEWLALDRPVTGSSLPMLNWRWIYGGAAKGQAMSGEASDVHATSGYTSLATYVNKKCQIKSDKSRTWTKDEAEKRWTYMKGQYRKAYFAAAPDPLNNDQYEEEMIQHAERQESICGSFKQLHELMKDHPATNPMHVRDTMIMKTPEESEDDLEIAPTQPAACEFGFDKHHEFDDEASAAGEQVTNDRESTKSVTSGPTAATKRGNRPISKQEAEKGKKKPFYLKKPATESSHKKTDIQTLFLQSQSELAAVEARKLELLQKGQEDVTAAKAAKLKQNASIEEGKLRVNAIVELAKAGINIDDMDKYLQKMFSKESE
jgi:hypothetical protein